MCLLFLFLFNSRRKGVSAVRLREQEKGQGLLEYGLIIVLVAIVVVAILFLLGPVVGNIFSSIQSELRQAGMGTVLLFFSSA